MGKINSYTPTSWAQGDELTEVKLNKIETGITDITEAVVEAQNGDQSLHTRISNISTKANNNESNIQTLQTAVGNNSSGLTKRITDAENDIAALQTTDANTSSAISGLTSRVSTNENNITSLQQTTNTLTQQYNTLPNNLSTDINALKTTVAAHASAIAHYETTEDEVLAAHASATTGADYASIDARFEAIESNLNVSSGGLTGRVDAIAAALGNASDDTAEPPVVASGLYADVEALQAEVEAAHRTLDEGTDNLDNRFDDAESRLDALEASIGDNEGNSLSGRVSALETTVGDSNNGLVKDVADIDAALNTESTGIEARLTAITSAAYTASNPPPSDSTKQDKITANGLLKGDGNGGVTAAVAGTDYINDISGKANASDVATLTGRVDTLETKDTIVMTVSNFTNLDATSENTNKNADYIVGPYVDEENAYKYYRIIGNNKVLISGGGGSGTSSAEFYADIANVNSPKDTVDYYIGNGTDGYTHYRYLNNTWVVVLPSDLVNSKETPLHQEPF